MKTRKMYMLFRLRIVSCIVLIFHYNGLLRSPNFLNPEAQGEHLAIQLFHGQLPDY